MRLPGKAVVNRTFTVPKVNLYPEDPFFDTPIGRIMRWSVGAGRHIIIFTELVVIVSFLSRFVLDRQLTDLNASLSQKSAVIASYGDLEAEFRSAQQQESDIEQILKQQGKLEVMTILTQITPPDIKYDSVSLNQGSLSLTGNASSLSSLIILVENAKRNPAFQRVSVGRLENGDRKEPGLSFTMNLVYTKGLQEFAPAASTAPVAPTSGVGATTVISTPAPASGVTP